MSTPTATIPAPQRKGLMARVLEGNGKPETDLEAQLATKLKAEESDYYKGFAESSSGIHHCGIPLGGGEADGSSSSSPQSMPDGNLADELEVATKAMQRVRELAGAVLNKLGSPAL